MFIFAIFAPALLLLIFPWGIRQPKWLAVYALLGGAFFIWTWSGANDHFDGGAFGLGDAIRGLWTKAFVLGITLWFPLAYFRKPDRY